MLLRAYSHTFAELKVHEERAFSRSCPKTALNQLASSLGLGSASSSSAASSPWIAAAATVMAACGAHGGDSVSSSLLEVDMPRFAASWAAKWVSGAGRLRLVQLQIYNGSRPCVLRASSVYNLGCAPTTTVAPEHTVFMPLL